MATNHLLMNYENIFHLVFDAFSKTHAPFALTGGYAMSYFRDTRFGPQIEILTTEKGFEKTFPLFQEAGCNFLYRNQAFIRISNAINSFLVLDIWLINEEDLLQFLKGGEEIERCGRKFGVPSLILLEQLKMEKPSLQLHQLSMDDYVNWIEFNLQHNLVQSTNDKDMLELTMKIPFGLK